ncbi:FxSxx-COOH system tetratricopeptide repeat protein [Streptomyces mirabilis]|uniref:FxSxx-COOH system tetratricopeptide repeat protein n=1 Tax=Streptomyces mirabilis TaxID=68239 RepID=UPI0036DD2B14
MGGSASKSIDIPDSVPDGPLRDWLTWLQELRRRANTPSLTDISKMINAQRKPVSQSTERQSTVSQSTVRRLLKGECLSHQSAYAVAYALAAMDTRPVPGKPSDDWEAFDRDLIRRYGAATSGAADTSVEASPCEASRDRSPTFQRGEADAGSPMWHQASEAISASRARHTPTEDVSTAEALYAAEKVKAAPGTSNLSEARRCLGRGKELAWLVGKLTGRQDGVATPTVVVTGLGGIGKTTLASEYAWLHHRNALVWWVNAASPDEIETSLTRLTDRLVPGHLVAAGRTAQVSWAMQWLTWHSDWLLVYDNVDDPSHLIPYTGALDRGYHLATSRRATGWADNTPILRLDLLRPDDATLLLRSLVCEGTTPTPRQEADLGALTSDLGNLPLALQQAGAYLAQNRGITVQAYRRRLESKLDMKAHGNSAERTIARTYDVTLDALEDVNPLAVEVLHTAAWLAPDEIPHTLLTPPGADPHDTAEAIGTLAAYSMLTDTGTHVSVHRLVQTVLRTSHTTSGGVQPPPCPPGRLRAEKAVLHHLTPPPHQDSVPAAQWDAVIPHLVALAATTPPGHFNGTLATAYNIAACLLNLRGHDARTIPLLEATVAQQRQDLGDTDRRTLTSRNNLASAYRAVGDLGRAISLFEATLAQCEQVLGDTDPDTLGSRNNLAGAYQEVGDSGRAIPLFEATLAQRERIRGAADPDTLTSRNNLASAYHYAGDLTKAIPLFEETLAQRQQVLGNTHVDTLGSRNNLACAYRDAGDLTRAISLLEATLLQWKEVLGDTHPHTLGSRDILAGAYQEAGDLGKAIPLFKATLAQREQIYGDTHPDTLTSRDGLACAYQAAEDLGKAIPLFEANLAQRERILGGTHPDTLTSRNNLASAYFHAKDLTRSVPLFEATLAQREQVLGNTHPHTLTSRYNLAGVYQEAGDLGKAISLFEATHAQCEQVLGDTHPHTLDSLRSLVAAYLAAGSLDKALPLLPSLLAPSE